VRKKIEVMMKRVATLVPFLALCLFFGTKSVSSINLGGVEVPKDKFIVYIMIGHSNMSGLLSKRIDAPYMDTRTGLYSQGL
jgi:hypothetical protein